METIVFVNLHVSYVINLIDCVAATKDRDRGRCTGNVIDFPHVITQIICYEIHASA